MINEVTNMEILEELNLFSEKMDKRIDKLEAKIDNLRIEVSQRLDYHEAWLNRIDTNVAWKKDLKA